MQNNPMNIETKDIIILYFFSSFTTYIKQKAESSKEKINIRPTKSTFIKE